MSAIEQERVMGFGALSLAMVEGVDGSSLRLSGPSFGRASARLAIASGQYEPRAGDSVLVGRADDGCLYVVGVVFALREVTSVRASDGSVAAIEDDEGREVLRLRDPEGRVLVTHHPAEGRSVIHASGDLGLRAEGNIDLAAAGAVRVRAGTNVEIVGAGDVALAAEDLDGERRSAISMREGVMGVTTERLAAKIDRADMTLGESNLVVGTIRTVARRMKLEVGVIETKAERIVERAQESWRETEGLSQTRAGRLRLVAKGAFQAIGQQALLKAREGVKIKGEKIYLA